MKHNILKQKKERFGRTFLTPNEYEECLYKNEWKIHSLFDVFKGNKKKMLEFACDEACGFVDDRFICKDTSIEIICGLAHYIKTQYSAYEYGEYMSTVYAKKTKAWKAYGHIPSMTKRQYRQHVLVEVYEDLEQRRNEIFNQRMSELSQQEQEPPTECRK